MRCQRAPERGSARAAPRAAALARRTPEIRRTPEKPTARPRGSAARLAKFTASSEKPPARHDAHSAQVVEIQRMRLLTGALAVVEEHGCAQVSVAQITASARVSRRTFYEQFENREACLTALVEHVIELLEAELAQAGLEGLPWRERVRGGLHTILCFCDREPALARICVVDAPYGDGQLQASRERRLARLAAIVDEGRHAGARAGDCSPLIAEGLVGAAVAILHARLARAQPQPQPLAGLLGELTGMIVLPYLGPAAARRERARPAPPAPAASPPSHTLALGDGDPLQGLSMRLTYRTTRVLGCIAAHPGVSNREVSDHAGVADQGQISRLLARLERLGLTTNMGAGFAKGEPNAWELTALGEQVAQRLQVGRDDESEAA